MTAAMKWIQRKASMGELRLEKRRAKGTKVWSPASPGGGSVWAASASSLCVMLVLVYLWASHGALWGILQLVCAQRNAKG